ncbi:hypothetical protein PG985_005621 [Apiospora marii]|uniref:uncharacterized protein n=1 Tax=Apiospora marii TaxID=335849 RepID=UPI00312D9D9D
MADVLGIIGDALGIYSFFADLFHQDSSGPVIRVAAALNDWNGLQDADGDVMVEAYDANHGYLGWGEAHVRSGDWVDMTLYGNALPHRQAPYIRLLGFNDAICVPYVTVTWEDGSKYGWVGDWGEQCGLWWYESGVYVDSSNHTPSCTWLDQDHSNGIPQSAIEIHIPEFTSDDTSKDPDSFCGTAFHSWRDWRDHDPATLSNQIFKRKHASPKRAQKPRATLDPRLVVSRLEHHRASKLCQSPTSYGPDFVSMTEKMHCNMETREVLPLCDGVMETDCFDVDGKRTILRGQIDTDPNRYSQVIEWA